MFADIMFCSSGFLNVLLYTITRPGVVRGSPQAPPPSDAERGLKSHSHNPTLSSHSGHGAISGGHVERRRVITAKASAGVIPLSPTHRALGRLPDLGEDEEEEQIALDSAIRRVHSRPHGVENSRVYPPPSRRTTSQDNDLGRLPDSDDEGSSSR